MIWTPWPRAAPVDAGRWVVLDVESTGLDTQRDSLLAIAAVAVRHDQHRAWIDLNDSFDSVLRHEAELPDKPNILLHGIGVGAQRAGTDPATVLRQFEDWAAGAPRLGFHVDFDRAMIERAQRLAGCRAVAAQWLDLEPLAAVLHPDMKARSLDEWLAHFRIPCVQRHQAIADALATAELLLRLWPRMVAEGGSDVAGMLRLIKARRWLPAG